MNKKLYSEWIEIADGDYDLAKRVFDCQWPKQNIRICFHCQQAAEKYLKGYLVYHNEEIVRTHILNELIDLCMKYDDGFEALRDMCTYLTPFAVQVRYPDHTFEIAEIEAKRSLDYVRIIIDFVSEKMKDKQ
ncbi:MAG: HEPN domain-containing protein [Clostridia bacterium]|nr:HEPN domain-containing protein [Clostridia bacterium]